MSDVNWHQTRRRFSHLAQYRCKRIGCWFLLGLWITLSNHQLSGQVNIAQGPKPPMKCMGNSWFFVQGRHELWCCDDRGYVMKQNNVDSFFEHAGMLIVEINGGRHQKLYQADGQLLSQFGNPYICGDGIVIAWEEGSLVNYYGKGGKLLMGLFKRTIGLSTAQIQGQWSICLPLWRDAGRIMKSSDIHCWGMINKAGQWLIEPKFDGPFSFQNGFAEVLYYGQKRKINEKGEFVE